MSPAPVTGPDLSKPDLPEPDVREPDANEAQATRRSRDAGVSSVEVVLLAPLIVMMILFIVALGVMVNVRSEVEGAARDAARAGSLQGSGQEAAVQAQNAADADLGSRCQGSATVTSAYVPPTGDGGGYYKVTVACTVDMSGFGMFGAHQTFSQTFAAPIDPLQNFHPGPVPTSTAPGPQQPSPTGTQFTIPSWLTPSVLPTDASTTTIGQPPPTTPTTPTGTDTLPTTPSTTPSTPKSTPTSAPTTSKTSKGH